MGRSRIRYEDVTGPPGPAAPYPELVEKLDEVGYQQVGLLGAKPVPRGYEGMAADYAPAVRTEMLANLPLPATVLRSPDGTALVAVSWAWGWPDLTFTTRMSDGSLVETRRRWDTVPPWPRARRFQRRYATVDGEMNRGASRGRSVTVVPSADARVLDEAHRAHVAAYAVVHGTEAVAAPSSMPEVVAFREGVWAHSSAVGRRHLLVGTVVVYAFVLAVSMVNAAVLLSGRPTQAVAVAAAAVVGAMLIGPWFKVHLVYVRWWRPPYRAGRYDVPRSSRTQTGSPQSSTP